MDNKIFWIQHVEKPLLKVMETHIVDYCNLNCKGCSHFSNLYHVGDIVSYDTYCKDLEQISKKVNLFRLNLLGGEVLLNDWIIGYISFARKVFTFTNICVITNGLLIPKQKKEIFNCCIDNDIQFEISEYPPTARIRQQIIDVLAQYSINFEFRNSINSFLKNMDLRGRGRKCYIFILKIFFKSSILQVLRYNSIFKGSKCTNILFLCI